MLYQASFSLGCTDRDMLFLVFSGGGGGGEKGEGRRSLSTDAHRSRRLS